MVAVPCVHVASATYIFMNSHTYFNIFHTPAWPLPKSASWPSFIPHRWRSSYISMGGCQAKASSDKHSPFPAASCKGHVTHPPHTSLAAPASRVVCWQQYRWEKRGLKGEKKGPKPNHNNTASYQKELWTLTKSILSHIITIPLLRELITTPPIHDNLVIILPESWLLVMECYFHLMRDTGFHGPLFIVAFPGRHS